MAETRDRMSQLVARIREDPGLPGRIPDPQRSVVEDALDGKNIHDIAQSRRLDEETVWAMLTNAARAASGEPPAHKIESAGMGSDTEPGPTGGYGETGFGSIGNESPPPTPEEK